MKLLDKVSELFVPTLGACLILCLLQPFGLDTIQEGRLKIILCDTALAIISVGLSYLFVKCFFSLNFKQKASATYRYGLCILHYVVNIPILSFFLTMYDAWNVGKNPEWHEFPYYMMYVGCISLILCIGSFLRIRSQIFKEELDDVKAINALLEERQVQWEQEQYDDEQEKQPVNEEKCSFKGQYNNATLEVLPKDLIYVESMANYADICYLDNGELRHKTLRLTLKIIKETLGSYDFIVQCHRAFLVNLNFVVTLSKESTGYTLKIFGTEKSIPVSRANTPLFKEKLLK